jgi:hypothetical protein
MIRAWVRHNGPGGCVAFILFMGTATVLAVAQQPTKPHPSPVPHLIILPLQLVSGEQATLAVLDTQGRLMPNVAVELSEGQMVMTDVTGRALFKAAEEPGTLIAKISGQTISASTTVIASEAPSGQASPAGRAGEAHVVSHPRFVEIHDRFSLEGSGFRGVADSNHIYLNDDPCLVVASSPVSLVVLPGPRVPVGDVKLRVTVAGMDAGQFAASAVLLEFSGPAPADAVNAGSSGKLILRAHGTTEPLALEVRNGSPGVIQLSKGNVQRLKTSGGDENIAPVEVKFVTGGNYSISARLLPADARLPELELAKKRLTEARKIASGDWSARIDQVLLKIDQAPENLPQIRAELRTMLNDKPAAPLASLLDSAWRELN